MVNQKPAAPCFNCHTVAWYWPGEYFIGKKRWLCGKCHPVTKVTVIKVTVISSTSYLLLILSYLLLFWKGNC